MHHYFLPLALLLLAGCAPQESEEIPPVDYATLTEVEKRLPENGPASFILGEGLGIQTFASEPMMINPTNLDVDERGRVWICEAQNYRRFNHDHPERTGGDRILIMEDLDGDGRADTSKVFYQGPEVNAALGIAKLGERVYVAASPNMLVFTDADGDDVPERMDTLFTGIEGVDHDHGVHAIVFGPDGKLYFNFGNEGKQLRDKYGEVVLDLRGQPVEEGKSHRQGMIFRCNPDGSELEVMAHNFRNNYEVALDAYGRMWQSDNDDDGNEGTRINFVMDYGNYGYHDEITGAAWQEARVGMHEEVPKRHWHLNDPGVVPNLLQTGSGSPTGILVYTGEQLPEVFHGQMIHCEPGHNVVRSYPITPAGAGYTAEIVDLVKSQDQWFRPSDVCAAPDGSLMIADWYDSGVGGHLMADIERGRVYRLYGPGSEGYQSAAPSVENIDEAIAALDHPNQAIRYLAYRRLANDPAAAKQLRSTVKASSQKAGTRARAAWVLADMEQSSGSVATVLFDSDEAALREMALRMARQYPGEENRELLSLVERAADTDDPALLREAALGLRFVEGARADKLYTQLASRYDGQDRWYLEALGIASDRYAEDRYAAWLATDPDLHNKAARDLIWRSRAPAAVAEYERILNETQEPEEMARFIRALHFQDEAVANPVIERAVLREDHTQPPHLLRYALASMSPESLQRNPAVRRRVAKIMPSLRGTDVWLMVAASAELRDEAPIMLDSALVSDDYSFRQQATKLVGKLKGTDYVRQRFARGDATEQLGIVQLTRHLYDDDIMDWLKELRTDDRQPAAIRQAATRSLANMWRGMTDLLAEVTRDSVITEEDRYTARVLSQAWRADIREGAISWLAANRTGEEIDLDAVAMLEGDSLHGEQVFTEYCAACHQVDGQGVRFGPNLSRIGEKLGKDALVASIAYPSQGIGFGYEGYEFTMADGDKLVGYIESQTENDLTVRMMGGVSKTVKKADIENRRALDESLMTAGLHQIMEQEELVDLVTYLKGLQKVSK